MTKFTRNFRITMIKIKRIKILLFVFFIAFINNVFAQQTLQVIRGKVVDKESNNYLVGATVTLYKDSILLNQTATDNKGNYRITDIPIGIYNIKITHLSYTSVTISKVVVNSAKEIILNIEMEETTSIMNEINVLSSSDKHLEWANGSVKQFSVEETSRYAGSRGDPARMVSNFAGVQGADDARNDIVIRGNSPL